MICIDQEDILFVAFVWYVAVSDGVAYRPGNMDYFLIVSDIDIL
jgi:hypothetical protein